MGGVPSASSKVLIHTVPHCWADIWCRQPLWPWETVVVEHGTCRLANDSGLPRQVGVGGLKFHDIAVTIFGKKV